MRVLFNILAVSISVISLTIAECGSPSPTIPAPSPVERPISGGIPEAEKVSFCDLVSSPELYNRKIVRTQASAVATSELAFLYEASCDSKEPWIDFEFENDQASKTLGPLIDRSLGKNKPRRSNVTVVGRFEGPSKEGYGHLNSFRFHFLIMAVEKAEPTPPEVPWPWETKNWKAKD